MNLGSKDERMKRNMNVKNNTLATIPMYLTSMK